MGIICEIRAGGGLNLLCIARAGMLYCAYKILEVCKYPIAIVSASSSSSF
jgi:hypothetical protein